MKEAPGSSETSVLTRATRRNNPEDTILHSHRRENLKSYILYIDYSPWEWGILPRPPTKSTDICTEIVNFHFYGQFFKKSLV
jgi:hypothetical protein